MCSGWALQTAPPCVETWRRSSPSSRDYVWLWRTVPSMKTLLLKRSQWPQCTHPALMLRQTVPHLLRCTHAVIYTELQDVFVFSLLLLYTKSFSLSGPLQSLGSSAESGRLLFKPDGSDQNPVPDLLFQPPFSCVHPDWPQVSSCTQNSHRLTLFKYWDKVVYGSAFLGYNFIR